MAGALWLMPVSAPGQQGQQGTAPSERAPLIVRVPPEGRGSRGGATGRGAGTGGRGSGGNMSTLNPNPGQQQHAAEAKRYVHQQLSCAAVTAITAYTSSSFVLGCEDGQLWLTGRLGSCQRLTNDVHCKLNINFMTRSRPQIAACRVHDDLLLTGDSTGRVSLYSLSADWTITHSK